jgi:O-methyltransferase involved in polyketide biosynthesis
MNDTAAAVRPTAAGMYDFYLDGTAHSPVDRAAAEQVMQLIPPIVDGAWANRGFLQRAVKRMASEWGIRQFIDIGAGLPTQYNTHHVALEVAPGSRVLYADNDPMTVAKGRELLAGVPGTAMIEADVRAPEAVLDHPETRRMIDPAAPVGLLMVAVLHFVPDDDDPWGLVSRYLDAVPSGSYLAVTHASSDEQMDETLRATVGKIYQNTTTPFVDRTKTEVERLFRGLELVPPYEGATPAIAFAGVWGAEDPVAADTEGSRWFYAGVARKP